MGLDQYANWTDGSTDQDGILKKEEFKYWRKQNHIQNWMQKKYSEKTGITDPTEFNCVSLEIDFSLLNEFASDVKQNKMQCTDGFFFGYSYDTNSPEVVEDDLRFASDCFFHLLMGRKVEYSSWW